MLYLMMDEKKKCNLVKVGESRQLNKRRRSYKTHNPCAIMRSTCAGTEMQETLCHMKLNKIGKRILNTEWYMVSDEIFTKLYEEGMGFFFPTGKNIYFDEMFK